MKRRVILNKNGILVATDKWVTKDGKLFGIHGKKNKRCSDHNNSNRGYISNYCYGSYIARHKLVADRFCVNPRPGYFKYTDHIDGNEQNNHADNLRHVSNQLNALNRISKPCKARHGRSKPFRAQIQFCYKYAHLGYFKTDREARHIMDKIRQELFDKLYDYETRPMCYREPKYWKISKYGVDVI